MTLKPLLRVRPSTLAKGQSFGRGREESLTCPWLTLVQPRMQSSYTLSKVALTAKTTAQSKTAIGMIVK
jgi:hypothetical protein